MRCDKIGNAKSVHESIAYEREVKRSARYCGPKPSIKPGTKVELMSLGDIVSYALGEQAGRDN